MHVCHAQCPTRTQRTANGIFAAGGTKTEGKGEARLYISNKSTARTLRGFPPPYTSMGAPSLFLIRIHYWYAPGYTARNVRSQAEFSYLS